MLYYGIPSDEHDKYRILHPQQWKYTNLVDINEKMGIKDAERFYELMEALKVFRIDDKIQNELWSIVSAIFNLGNINFIRTSDGYTEISQTSMDMLNKIAALSGIESKALQNRLTNTSIKVMKRDLVRNLPFDDAIVNTDNIAQSMYNKLFLYLCDRVNDELYQIDDDDTRRLLFIGVLDIIGFGNYLSNSLEQFCYNYLNEKIHQYFIYHIIQSENEEYIKESVFWKPVSIPDNAEYINMMEDKQNGFFVILDSSCKAPQISIVAFLQDLFKRHRNNPCISKKNKPKYADEQKAERKRDYQGIEIKHYADTVDYDVSLFQIKNMSSMRPDTSKMLKKSKVNLVKQFGSAGRRGRAKWSVTGVYVRGIKTLCKNLKCTEPHFIHCIKPNMNKSADEWDEDRIERQLKYNGIAEALIVIKSGYSARVPYSTLYDRYHGNITNPLVNNFGVELFCHALLFGFGVDSEDYELGLTKIFFKPNKGNILDDIMNESGKPLRKEIDLRITRWVIDKRINQIIGICKAFLLIKYNKLKLENSQ